MIEFLENEKLRIKVKVIGAELCGIYSHRYRCEYLWQAQEAWRKYAPNLFPIVGALKDDIYHYKNESYKMFRHGFAGNKLFKLVHIAEDELSFELTDDESTLTQYPFYFKFMVTYKLIENKLQITYHVQNNSHESMYFSVGGHPAFNIPFEEGETYTDYYLEFEKPESLEHFPITDNLLELKAKKIKTETTTNGNAVLPLQKSLFKNDALVFKKLNSRTVAIKSKLNEQSVTVRYEGFNHLGIWAAKNADFVCIEPWLGLADSVDSTQDIAKKESIITLDGHQTFTCSYEIEVA